MEANKLRLNQQKRQLLKREWSNTVWNKTPMEVEDNLKLAIENYRTTKQQTWDNVITPLMDSKFPIEDMNILAKYDRGNNYSRFTEIDQCFYFKPTHTDSSESQYKWTISNNEMRALYHFELQEKGNQATLDVEYDETKRDRNPHYHEKSNAIDEHLRSVSTSLDRGLWFESRGGYHRRNNSDYNDDVSAFSRIVPNSGGCHSRVMMCDEHHWEQLKMYAKAQSGLTNAHRELWQMKYELIKDMNSIIDQAKFLSDVQEYWQDVEDCVRFDTSDISRELSIVSDDTKERLKHSLAVRQTAREQQPKEVEVAVPTQGFAMVN